MSFHGIEQLAREIAGDERDPHVQVRRLIQWMHQAFEWTATDYQQRTVCIRKCIKLQVGP